MEFEIRRDVVNRTSDGTVGGKPDSHDHYVTGKARYFVDGHEVTQAEYERLENEHRGSKDEGRYERGC